MRELWWAVAAVGWEVTVGVTGGCVQVPVEPLPDDCAGKALADEVQRRVVAAFHTLRQRLPADEQDAVSSKYLENANGRRIPLCGRLASCPVLTSCIHCL